jgi:hypothetical protein
LYEPSAVDDENDDTVGGVVSMFCAADVEAGQVVVIGPVVLARSLTALALTVRMTVPVVAPEAPVVTVYGPAPEPDTDETVTPLAVPPTVKSSVPRPVTGRVNVSVNAGVRLVVAPLAAKLSTARLGWATFT